MTLDAIAAAVEKIKKDARKSGTAGIPVAQEQRLRTWLMFEAILDLERQVGTDTITVEINRAMSAVLDDWLTVQKMSLVNF